MGSNSASWLGVPLRTPSGTIGVLVVQHYEEAGVYRQRDLEFLSAVGDQVALAIERKRAEAALARSEILNRSLVEHLPHRIFVKDRNSAYLFCNSNYALDLGIGSKQIVGKDDFAFYPPAMAEGYRADDREVMAAGKTKDVEERYGVAGPERWVHTVKVPYQNEQEEIIGVLGLFEDITERKRAEAERQVITDIVQAVITTSNLDELFSLAHQAISKILLAENCYVALYDKTSDLLHIPYCKDEFDPVAAPQKLGRGLTAFVLRSRRPMLLAPQLIQELVSKGEIELIGTLPAAWLGVPLRTSTDTIGVLVVQHYEKAGAYTQRDLEFLSAVGDQVALAIERKRAEGAVAHSEKRYRELIDNGLGLICTHDLDGKLLSINPAAAGALGYTPAEMVGRNLIEYISPSAQPVFPHYLKRIATEPHVSGLMNLLSRKGEEQIWKYSNSRVAEPGAIAYVLGFAQDVTDSKRAEEALTESEQRFRDLFENASDVIYTADFEGNFTSLNKSGERMTGYTREEALHLNFSQVVAPETRKLVQEMTERKFKSPDETVYEIEFLKKGGEPLLVEVSSRAIYKNGKPVGIQGIGRDITQRKQVEAELKLARDMALESVRLKSEFLANMSHEIRTPMNGVIGMTGLLLDTNLDEEQRDCAETIRASGETLLTIINDILDFSKIEAGKLQFETLDFLLNTAVEDTIELLAERAYDKNLELACLVYSDVPTALRGDPGRLRQVLTNLIGNAIKFTESGEVIVRVEKESETDDGVVVRFMVTDTGIGISEDAQRNLFQAFTQADGSTTRRYGGTGLGLAISKQLIELMGGEIGIDSKLGQGSTVWFTARFAKQPADAVISQPQLMSLDRLRILIVDDNVTNRKILSHQVSSWGMSHQEADSGARALELLRSAAAEGAGYDLAVLDFMMPGMDGFELARKIKSDPGTAAVNLVMLTSLGERGHGAAAREAGVAAYLTKPVRQSQLFDCLANVISSATAGPARNVSASPVKLVTRHTLKESKMMSHKLILVAEDNVVNQKVALRQLLKLGYRAHAVANGCEVLEALARIPYDLVLMDCQMPEMDGYEATSEIRQREGTAKHTLIVAMTANALVGDRAKCIAAGMDDYVSKPVRPEELGAVLERSFRYRGNGGRPRRAIVEKTSAPVNMKQLSSVIGDEPYKCAEILEVYLDQMVTNLERLGAAIELQDAETVDLIARNCAGTSAHCGIVAIVDPLREMECMGRENRLDDAAVLLADISREFARAQSFLQENLKVVVA
ncbi:MAG TPA: PAS domain S-box protein [Pyrinomonadaceae bacterium]|nr:PAS domain S-box protein [Pyrinomonadaceae bacterium]